MKKLVYFSIFIFLSIFICNAQQNQSDEYKNRWKIVEEKNQSFQNGKIEFDYSYRKKDSTDFITKPYTLIYSKEISYTKKKYRFIQERFNVVNEKDSMQYIFTEKCLATINHKEKTVELDTIIRWWNYYYFLPEITSYYLEKTSYYFGNNLQYKLLKNENSLIFHVNAGSFMGNISDTYKDSIRNILKTEKLSRKRRKSLSSSMITMNYNNYYEFSLHDTILKVFLKKVENENILKENAIVEQKSVLTKYDFNNDEYNSEGLYDYRNYSQGYVVSYTVSRKAKIMEQQKLFNTTASAFELPVVNENKIIKLEDYKGKWVLLDFWFISCKPCMLLMPKIEEIYKNYHAKGLEIIGINVDKNDERLQNFVKEKNIPYPTLSCEDKSVSKLYNVFGYPTLVLINPQQEIIFIGSGTDAGDKVEKLLKVNLK